MKIKSIYIVDVLNDFHLDKSISMHANCVICNENNVSKIIPDGIEVINAEIYRVEGTWKVYEYNDEIVSRLITNSPQSFKLFGYSLESIISKTIYWNNYRFGPLYVAYDLIEIPKKIINKFELIKANWFKECFKFSKFYLKNCIDFMRIKSVFITKTPRAKLGILVNNEFELKLYFDVIESLKHDDLILFHYGNIEEFDLNVIPTNVQKFNLSLINAIAYQPFLMPLLFNSKELISINLIAKDWNNIATEIQQYIFIKQVGIEKLLINVAENIPVRNLMSQVFDGKIEVYNTMNGLKSGEAHDSDITFDKWFVWDKFMRDLLHEKCKLAYSKLIVSGHLSQDLISNYNFKNTFNFDLDSIKGKKIISIFSVRGYRKEKLDAFEVLYEFLEKNEDFFLFVKPHPLEQVKDYITPNSKVKNVFFLPEFAKNSKDALYDQLFLTDLSIVFGSTVALESKWMGVPCLSFEYKQQSLIYNLSSNEITHIKSKNELFEYIKNCISKSISKNEPNQNVSKIIAESLLTKN